jgi:hypothetical protein
MARGFAAAPGGDQSGAAVLRRLALSMAVLLALLAVEVRAAMAGDTTAQATPDAAAIDPVVGLRLRHQFTPSQEIMVRGDVGGFGFQSNFEWQAVGVHSYAWQLTGYQLAALIGYRALGVNYTNTGNNNGVDLVLHGPIIGFSVRF